MATLPALFGSCPHGSPRLRTTYGARAPFVTHLSNPSYPAFPISALPSLHLDPVVVENSLNASLNLVTVCGFVVFMQKFGYLPPSTASVLSQVSFNLIIPSFLMSKVCLTIASNHARSFISLPVVAIVQIIVGGILGRLSYLFLFRKINNVKSKNRNAIAKEALVTVACAFGNSVTLPLVFLNGMLPQTDYGSAAGYLALFLIGWSPCLWTLGYQIMSSSSAGFDAWENVKPFTWLRNLMNPPLYGAAKLLGSAAVPLQAIVLASTLASSIKHIPVQKAIGVEEHINITGSVNDFDLDTEAFLAIVIIRLVIMPIMTLILLMVMPQEWMPADRMARLTILVASAMPTAQNLVVLAQLHSHTQPFAGAIANLLVKQYAISAVTVTVWMPIFFSYLSIN